MSKKDLPEMGFEPGSPRWESVALTMTITGLANAGLNEGLIRHN